MDKNTKVAAVKFLARAAAELAADVAGTLSEASGSADHGNVAQTVGAMMGAEQDLARIETLIASVKALNTAREER